MKSSRKKALVTVLLALGLAAGVAYWVVEKGSPAGSSLWPWSKRSAAAASPAHDAKGAAGERKVKYYKSTMMLGEISQTPRKDSMGMAMVPVYEDDAAGAAQIVIDPVTTQNMGLRTAEVTKGPLRRTVRTVGILEPNETALADVTTKFKGWI